MNGQNVYLIQCTAENFEEAKCLAQMYCHVVDLDDTSYLIKTTSIDRNTMQRLDDLGVRFWQEPHVAEPKKKKKKKG